MEGFSYIPGEEPQKSPPLGRYLPPILHGVATAFLSRTASKDGSLQGEWILDPFGASPSLAVEIARLGYCMLVAVNNPVTRFLFEMAAQPPSRADLQAALAELASARKGDERLETHLQSLYLTECTRCQQQVPAEAFIWDKTTGDLTGRIYHCSCGDSGEYPATEADRKRAAAHAATDSLHRSRALERVAARDDPDRPHTEEALVCYLPRAVYALITIINKLDNLSLPPARRRALIALILTACDEASSLWSYPTERPRPRQLNLPAHFLEKNVWLTLEYAVDAWSDDGKPVQVVSFPAMPGSEGGLCLYEGPVRDLAPHLKDLSLGAVITALPRPNQAFWSLSTLWAGWLWGREAAAPFKAVLRRRRYDWNWHGFALQAALKNLTERIPLNAPFFALIPEVEPQFLSAVLLAAAASGFDLSGIALRTRHDPLQVLWHRRAFSREHKDAVGREFAGEETQEPPDQHPDVVLSSILSALRERGEPSTYLFLHAAGLSAVAYDHSLEWGEAVLNLAQAPILTALTLPDFIHYSSSNNPEVGLWGLADSASAGEPLPDRLEVALVRYLQKNPGCTMPEIETAMNREFPGLQTPSWGLINAVLSSYAIKEARNWNLRPEDSASLRRADLETTEQSLVRLGARLGFIIERQDKPSRRILWLENGQVQYIFHLLASAVIGRILRQDDSPPTVNRFLVIPGGRAGLLAYKLSRDPSLAALAREWRILKFRHLRRLAEMTAPSRLAFEKNLTADPIEPPEQMKLF